MKIKVAIAEDNKMLAASIEEKLRLFGDEIEFVFAAGNGKELIDKLESGGGVDIILMDIEMPECDGIEATALVREKFPNIKVIMLTVFDDDDKIFRSIQAGAMGYLLKDESPDKIYESIKMILNGGAPMSPSIAAKSLNLLRSADLVKLSKGETDFALSEREVEVLERLKNGENYNQIAEKLFISPSTVRKHIENIYKKLQVHNKIQAVQKAIKHNII